MSKGRNLRPICYDSDAKNHSNGDQQCETRRPAVMLVFVDIGHDLPPIACRRRPPNRKYRSSRPLAKRMARPLPIAQRVEKPAFGISGTPNRMSGWRRSPASLCRAQEPARGAYRQCPGERPSICDGGELFPEAVCLHQASARYSVLRIGLRPGAPLEITRKSANLDAYHLYGG